MADWPNIANPSGLKEYKGKGQLKSEFDAGYVQSRPKFTRSRKHFELSWNVMTDADKETLETFFDNNLGDTFTWDHPLADSSDSSYTVRFVEDELQAGYILGTNHWKVQLTLEEQ